MLVLFSVWGTYLMQKSVAKDWSGLITIKVIPVFADRSLSTRRFVKSLKPDDFSEVSRYLTENAKAYGLDLSNVLDVRLEPPIESTPPLVPSQDASRLAKLVWSLQLRWWAWKNQTSEHQDYHVRLFMLYQSPQKGVRLAHSTGLRNGLIGLINARAFKENKRFHNVILVHELLHIFGATDKYDLTTGQPIFPQGYISPDARPRWPQRYAEIMGRARALSKEKFEVAVRLRQTRISELTAYEIGWTDS